jgi:energy-coupling factor transport system permease protein
MHRLWAGTKLLCVVAIVVTLTLIPSWLSLALFAVLVLLAAVVAQVPRTVVPRLPAWFWGSLLIGAMIALAAGRPPALVLGSVHIGFGGLLTFLRAIVLGVVLLATSAVVTWTTPLGDLAPAVSRMGAPLRKLRVPVDELAATIALCVRCLPLLLDEMRTLLAARRLRPPYVAGAAAEDLQRADAPAHQPSKARRTAQRVLAEPADLLGAALAVSMRRAGELGEALTARGGVTTGVGTRPGPGLSDVVAGLVVAATCATALALHLG